MDRRYTAGRPMPSMRALLLAALFVVVPLPAFVQGLSVLHVTVTLLDADQKPMPVPRHVLLVSDNPASAPPRRVLTALDGTVDIKLVPGTYTGNRIVPLFSMARRISGRRWWTSRAAATRPSN